MPVDVIDQGMEVEVIPDDVDVIDILDYAEELLTVYPWRQGDRGDVQLEDLPKGLGFSLHDSIGYACERLSALVNDKVTPSATQRTAGSKDWMPEAREGFESQRKNLRQEATNALQKVLPQGINDIAFNDQAKSVDEVLKVIQEAREEVKRGT